MRHHSQFHLLSVQFKKKTYSLRLNGLVAFIEDSKFCLCPSQHTRLERVRRKKKQRRNASVSKTIGTLRSNAHQFEEIVECNLTVGTRWPIIDMIRSHIPVEDWRGESEQSTHIHTNKWTESRIVCANNDRFCNVLHAITKRKREGGGQHE